MEILSSIWLIFKNWWWVFLPIILWYGVRFFYFWWLRWEVWYPKFNWILLEIRPPKEILKPFRAMESIFSSLWGIISSPNWREKWCEGVLPLGGGLWFSFEIMATNGEIHFYIRVPEEFRTTAESVIYSQYPEVEISLVDDYTKNVPKDIPNKEWDLNGYDFTLAKNDPYPIKTYPMFFEERPEIVKEEKRLDPMDVLLEELGKLKSGEYVWIQIVCNPINETIFVPWVDKGREIADKIAKRPVKSKPIPIVTPIVREIGEFLRVLASLISGRPTPPAGKKEESSLEKLLPVEERLTPGEKEVLTAVENKIKKHAYQTWIRTLHLYKVNESYTPAFHTTLCSYFMGQFMTFLNNLVFYGPTRTKIQYLLRQRRLYLRKRILFKRYLDRLPSLWPRTMTGEPFFRYGHKQGRSPGIRATSVLNIEELATIFHFPAKIVTPGLPYIEAKKAAPPPGLPVK